MDIRVWLQLGSMGGTFTLQAYSSLNLTDLKNLNLALKDELPAPCHQEEHEELARWGLRQRQHRSGAPKGVSQCAEILALAVLRVTGLD